jgi:hypothetical protein
MPSEHLMEFVSVGEWRVRCDPDATRRAYERVGVGAPEACGCLDCRNFAAARDRAYPAEVLTLLDRLGINPSREAEVYFTGETESGLRLYGVWFHFVGSVVRGSDTDSALVLELGEHFKMYFTNHVTLVQEPLGGHEVAQLEFWATVPWVLDEPEPKGPRTSPEGV